MTQRKAARREKPRKHILRKRNTTKKTIENSYAEFKRFLWQSENAIITLLFLQKAAKKGGRLSHGVHRDREGAAKCS